MARQNIETLLSYNCLTDAAQMLDTTSTSVKMVDECANSWDCVLIFGTAPYEHCKVGGEWKRFMEARRLREGVRTRLGAPMVGKNDTIFVTVVYN